MSLVYSNTSTKRGIIQEIEKELGFDYGYITGNTDLHYEINSLVNLAHDDLLDIGFKSGGTWQLDDSNHTDDFPFIFANLVSGQRDYAFTTDENGNLILDIMRVMVADSSGVFREIYPVDQQTPNSFRVNTDSLIDGRNQTGTPIRYEKTGNSILLDLIPNYNYTRGLKVFINREGSYFTIADTTRKPGIPGTLHRWYVIKPSMDYARRNSLASYNRLAEEVLRYEGNEDLGIVGKIARTFGRREKDIPRRMFPSRENNK